MTNHHAQEYSFNYHKITDKVYFGSAVPSADKVDELKEKGVEVIFSIQGPEDEQQFGHDINGVREKAAASGIKHVWVPSPDATPAHLINAIKKVVEATEGKKDAVCYTHCTHGVSRGPSFGIAYLYWVTGLSLTEAHEAGKAERKIAPKIANIEEATRQLLGTQDIDFSKPLTEEQRALILKKLAEA